MTLHSVPLLFALTLTLPLYAGSEEMIETDSKVVLEPIETEPRRGGWFLGGGISARRLGETSLKFDGINPASLRGLPLGVGTLGSISDREYDNGFNRIGTGTAASGLTSFFGYDRAPLIANDQLVLTRSGGQSLGTYRNQNASDETLAAPYLELGYLSSISETVDFGFSANFSWFGLDQDLSQNLTRQSLTTIDRFDLGGVIIPDQPYIGPETIGLPGAPLIPNVPAQREITASDLGFQSAGFDLDLDVFSLALGPELKVYQTDDFYFTFGAGIVLNYVNWDTEATFPSIGADNRLIVNNVKQDGDEFLWGAYAEVAIGYSITPSLDLELSGRYDWSENLELSDGFTSLETDLSGWSIAAGLRFGF